LFSKIQTTKTRVAEVVKNLIKMRKATKKMMMILVQVQVLIKADLKMTREVKRKFAVTKPTTTRSDNW
jgi:hypothetical protein